MILCLPIPKPYEHIVLKLSHLSSFFPKFFLPLFRQVLLWSTLIRECLEGHDIFLNIKKKKGLQINMHFKETFKNLLLNNWISFFLTLCQVDIKSIQLLNCFSCSEHFSWQSQIQFVWKIYEANEKDLFRLIFLSKDNLRESYPGTIGSAYNVHLTWGQENECAHAEITHL